MLFVVLAMRFYCIGICGFICRGYAFLRGGDGYWCWVLVVYFILASGSLVGCGFGRYLVSD